MEGKEKELDLNKAEALFRKLNENGGITVQKILEELEEHGIGRNEPRLKKILGENLQDEEDLQRKIDKEQFADLLKKHDLLKRGLQGSLIIPDFKDFREDIKEIFEEVKSNTEGERDETLPHPDKEEKPGFAVSICTVDGQLLQIGDHDLNFLLQSICKPVNYAIVVEELGQDKLREHVGVEPGSESFDSGMILNEDDLPHNPMITSGAIMTANFIKPEMEVEDRLKHVMSVWEKITGGRKVKYNKESFEAEQKNADKHQALAHIMKQRGAFPEDVDLITLIDFYLKCCAIEMSIDDLAHAAATFANYGACPTTGEKVFGHDTVRNTLSLMYSSGMYDHSGEFAFRVGLPAKSGIAGGIMVVIPEVMGIAVYSPLLDPHGNSVRGVEFCEKLVQKFNFHKFDTGRSSRHGKKDPVLKRS